MSDDNYFISNEEYIKLVKKAADEIELLREENEKLREELITSSEKYYDIGYACAKDMQKDRIESSEEAYVRLDAAMNRLKGAFRVNMLRAFPNMSHDEIDAEINKAIRENDDE